MISMWLMGLALAGEVQPIGELAALAQQCVPGDTVSVRALPIGWMAMAGEPDAGGVALDVAKWTCDGKDAGERGALSIDASAVVGACTEAFTADHPGQKAHFGGFELREDRDDALGIWLMWTEAKEGEAPAQRIEQYWAKRDASGCTAK